jgi:hypothetical protein
MPTTIQISIVMKDSNNYANENLNDVFESQFGRHVTASIPQVQVGGLAPFPWPTTGETMLYLKFPQQAADYDVGFLTTNTSNEPVLLLTIPAGSSFIPVMLPKAHEVVPAETFTYYIFSTSAIDTLPMFYF